MNKRIPSAILILSILICLVLSGCKDEKPEVVATQDQLSTPQQVETQATQQTESTIVETQSPTKRVPGPYEVYIPAIEDSLTSSSNSCYGSCFLYDMDEDDFDELVIVNSYKSIDEKNISAHAYSVLDMEDDKLVTHLDRELLFYDAGGPFGEVGMANYLGDLVFFAHTETGETGYEANRVAEYKLYDPSEFYEVVYATVDYFYGEEKQGSNCIINDSECSYDGFLAFEESIEKIIIAERYANNAEDNSMDLYEMLRHIQKISSVKATKIPAITEKEADEVVNEVWGEYLLRDQGFEWKIQKEDSIVKDDVLYYCYTLRSEPYNDKDEWDVSQYGFVNSLDGEFLELLY